MAPKRDIAYRIVQFLGQHNADLYATIASAVLLTGVQLWAREWTNALFAGTLGTLAISLIRLRQDFGNLREHRLGLSGVFSDHTSPDVIATFPRAASLLLIGVSLDRTIRNAYTQLEQFLRAGGSLRVLVVDPAALSTVAIADRRAYNEHGIEQRKAHILASITQFELLSQRTGRHVDIRLTQDPLTFGATMIDGRENTRHTCIVIQHYSYKKRDAAEPNPVFTVRPADGKWFQDFSEELENLWRDAQPQLADSAVRKSASPRLPSSDREDPSDNPDAARP